MAGIYQGDDFKSFGETLPKSLERRGVTSSAVSLDAERTRVDVSVSGVQFGRVGRKHIKPLSGVLQSQNVGLDTAGFGYRETLEDKVYSKISMVGVAQEDPVVADILERLAQHFHGLTYVSVETDDAVLTVQASHISLREFIVNEQMLDIRKALTKLGVRVGEGDMERVLGIATK